MMPPEENQRQQQRDSRQQREKGQQRRKNCSRIFGNGVCVEDDPADREKGQRPPENQLSVRPSLGDPCPRTRLAQRFMSHVPFCLTTLAATSGRRGRRAALLFCPHALDTGRCRAYPQPPVRESPRRALPGPGQGGWQAGARPARLPSLRAARRHDCRGR